MLARSAAALPDGVGWAFEPKLDGYRCTNCGATEDLTVDLDPRLQGNHRIATVVDCVTACRSCNSRRAARPLPR